jgi:flavin reductase (DIM6/NTAB) family NADH-FMN oxidoreductase RutF
VGAPLIGECPVNIECKVTEIKELGSHDMFIAEVVAVHADEKYMDKNGRFDLALAEPIAYSHGEYYTLGEKIGKFGYSVKK